MTRAEFDAAQSVKKSLSHASATDSVASQAMLGGVARCAACGHTLKITGNTDKKTGARYPDLLLHRPLRLRPLPRPRDRPRLPARHLRRSTGPPSTPGRRRPPRPGGRCLTEDRRGGPGCRRSRTRTRPLPRQPQTPHPPRRSQVHRGRRSATKRSRRDTAVASRTPHPKHPYRRTRRRRPPPRLANPHNPRKAAADARPARPRARQPRRQARPPRTTNRRTNTDHPPRRHRSREQHHADRRYSRRNPLTTPARLSHHDCEAQPSRDEPTATYHRARGRAEVTYAPFRTASEARMVRRGVYGSSR